MRSGGPRPPDPRGAERFHEERAAYTVASAQPDLEAGIRAIRETLAACNGSRIETARRLGISERTLRYRLASMRGAGMLAAGGAA